MILDGGGKGHTFTLFVVTTQSILSIIKVKPTNRPSHDPSVAITGTAVPLLVMALPLSRLKSTLERWNLSTLGLFALYLKVRLFVSSLSMCLRVFRIISNGLVVSFFAVERPSPTLPIHERTFWDIHFWLRLSWLWITLMIATLL